MTNRSLTLAKVFGVAFRQGRPRLPQFHRRPVGRDRRVRVRYFNMFKTAGRRQRHLRHTFGHFTVVTSSGQPGPYANGGRRFDKLVRYSGTSANRRVATRGYARGGRMAWWSGRSVVLPLLAVAKYSIIEHWHTVKTGGDDNASLPLLRYYTSPCRLGDLCSLFVRRL